MTKRPEIPNGFKFEIEPITGGVELTLRNTMPSGPTYFGRETVLDFFGRDNHMGVLVPLSVVNVLSTMVAIACTLSMVGGKAPVIMAAMISWSIVLTCGLVWATLWKLSRRGGCLDLDHEVARAKRKMLKDYRKKLARENEITAIIKQNETTVEDEITVGRANYHKHTRRRSAIKHVTATGPEVPDSEAIADIAETLIEGMPVPPTPPAPSIPTISATVDKEELRKWVRQNYPETSFKMDE